MVLAGYMDDDSVDSGDPWRKLRRPSSTRSRPTDTYCCAPQSTGGAILVDD